MNREKSTRGRKQLKTPAFRFRAMAYYLAIACEAELELGHPPSAADLSHLFAGHTSGSDSKIWSEYKAGRSMPARGSYRKADAGLARAIEQRYPRTSTVRDHPLWTLIDRIELDLPAIHDLIMQLPEEVSRLLMRRDGFEFKRWYSNPLLEAPTLVAGESIDDLAAVIALVREANLKDDMSRSEQALYGMIQLLPVLRRTPYIAPFAEELEQYLRSTFKRHWVLSFYLGGDHP